MHKLTPDSASLQAASSDYDAFLRRKHLAAPIFGFEIDGELSPLLYDFQRDIVRWACRRGRAAIFADCGLGKTGMQLEWARQVHRHTNGDVLILAPLAVTAQTRREGEKFGIPVTVCRSQSDVRPGVNVTNYQMLHQFDAKHFVGVVLDESGILKNFMGATKRALMDAFDETAFRLCCTATPAPNDHLELGNHCAFLGIMPANEMIMRWFINDTMAAGNYRLKKHAEKDYWRWVTTWAVACSNPSDLGYAGTRFVLPPLDVRTHVVEVDRTDQSGESLFRDASLSATTMHAEMRRTVDDRARRVAELVAADPGVWVIWCNTNYEADALRAVLPGAAEVRGTETIEEKERKLLAFAAGEVRILVTKPTVAGFGMNWQHCHRMAFVGLSYSYEQFYQAIRRSWRFGQPYAVTAHVICAETEGDVLRAIQRKQEDHEVMKMAMTEAMRDTALDGEVHRRTLQEYAPDTRMVLPAWLRAVA